jgi:hypothetical protein
MGDAMVRANIDKLNQIYADDFATVASSGKVITKKDRYATLNLSMTDSSRSKMGPLTCRCSATSPWRMAVSPKSGLATEKTRAVSSFEWISSRNETAIGWWCAAQEKG